MQSDLDGPLVNYTARGTKIELEGTENIEGKDTYRLKLTLKGGQTQRVWLDAKTFLETKIEGTPRRLDGKYHTVAVYYRDYRPVSGLMMSDYDGNEGRGRPADRKNRNRDDYRQCARGGLSFCKAAVSGTRPLAAKSTSLTGHATRIL